MSQQQQNSANFIWSISDLLRGPYKPHQYGAVVLPFTILRRLDCVLEPTKQVVLDEASKRGDAASASVFLTKAILALLARDFYEKYGREGVA